MATARDNLARRHIIIPVTQPEKAITLRVAAYCRVSTDSDDQMNSFAAQYNHYITMIGDHDNWEMADIYADEGISGRTAKKREDFQRMLDDCRKGRIDKILVKSISRFARNTAECLETIREIKALGISIFFEEHNIDTKMVSSEMLTAVIAACAQAESESISQNMRWSYQRRMESGEFITCKAPFGYRLIEGNLVVEETEAEIVRKIYHLFLSGWNTAEIAEEITRMGIKSRDGLDHWGVKGVRYVLTNEKYVGDSLLRKRYTTEAFPPEKRHNHGEVAQYYVENTHPPIIDRDTFQCVQTLYRSKRAGITGKAKLEHDLKQKIICGCCGTYFRRTVSNDTAYWVCTLHHKGGKCGVQPILEREVYQAFCRLHFNLRRNREILDSMLKNMNLIRNRQMLWHPDIIELNKRIGDITSQSHSLSVLNQQGLVDSDIFIYKSNQLAEQLRKAKQEKERLLKKEDTDLISKTQMLQEVLEDSPEFFGMFDAELFCELVEKIIVESNTKIRFRLKNGLELPEFLERTVR